MALKFFDHFKPLGMLNGMPFPVMKVTKGSAVTWKKGAVLIPASGLAVEAADGPTTGTILGVALNKAIDGQTEKEIVPALPGVVFSGRIATGDTGSDYTSLVTNRYSRFGIALDASGAWYINVADVTDFAVLVLEFIDDIGTNLALVKFTFIDSMFGDLT